MELKITKHIELLAKNIEVDDDGQADTFDMIEIAIEIGEENNLYNNGDWNDVDREKCYNKAYEII
tara:strand:- start:60 stop:254 length:195 start_codon:yes stop_codon:yes gene_type:complete